MSITDDFNRTPLITYGMFLKDKTMKYKSDIFNTQVANMMKSMMNLFVRIISELILSGMLIVTIDMDLREILNCMKAMIVRIVHLGLNV